MQVTNVRAEIALPNSINSCFPFGQKNRSELLLSLKPHVPFARNGGHHAHWFYRSLSPQGPPFVQRRVAQTCILT
jgi:hypothetical protein